MWQMLVCHLLHGSGTKRPRSISDNTVFILLLSCGSHVCVCVCACAVCVRVLCVCVCVCARASVCAHAQRLCKCENSVKQGKQQTSFLFFIPFQYNLAFTITACLLCQTMRTHTKRWPCYPLNAAVTRTTTAPTWPQPHGGGMGGISKIQTFRGYF